MNYFFFLKDGNNIFDMRSIFDLGWDCPQPLVISSRYKKNWQTPLSRPRVCPESVLFNKGFVLSRNASHAKPTCKITLA